MARTKIPLVIFTDTGGFAANAKVVVNNRASGTPATVYTTEGGSTAATQPLVCDSRGRCPGWLDRGGYTAVVSGTGVTAYSVDFDSAPASAGSIDTAWLADDVITAAKIADHAVLPIHLDYTNMPVGSVIEWWGPAGTPLTLPAGFVEATGQTLVAGQHDFPVGGSVVLPDFRNRHSVGADSLKAWGTATAAGSGAWDASAAPGIGGTGGSNAPRNLQHKHQFLHTHTVPFIDHYHLPGSLYAVDHAHGVSIGFTTGSGNRGAVMQLGGGAEAGTFLNHQHFGTVSGGTGGSGNLAIGGNTNWASGQAGSVATSSQSVTSTEDSLLGTTDVRPAHIGVVRAIKVKNQ
jgi:hypothetical protein